MSSIALFPCTYTPVTPMISNLSKALSLKVYDDESLFTEMMKRYGYSLEKMKKCMYEKTSVFNQFTLEKERFVNRFRSILIDRLESPEQYFFHGFHTLLIPEAITHVLKVLVVDTKASRIERAMLQGLSKAEAKRAIKEDDVSAYSWSDFLFRKEAYDASLYDMVVPVLRKTDGELIETLARSFHKTSVLRTVESMRAVHDLKLQMTVEWELLENGHAMMVQAQGGKIRLVVDKNVLNFGKLEMELIAIVSNVEGVRQVTVEKVPSYYESIYRRQKFELPSKVLFVDDEKDFVETVSQRLISRDVGIYGVYNGEEALELIVKDRPDVMVLDLKMPGLHGVEVLRQTKEIDPDIEVIILTGHGTSEDMKQCMELGAFAYMNKPVDIEELSATIKAANDQAQERSGVGLESSGR